MDPRIGQLNGGKFYAYVNGYSAEPFMGTLEQVEVALGLRTAAPAPVAPRQQSKVYDVTLRFQFPAWDEVDGLLYRGISACSKSAANEQVRRMARDDGHICGHKGRVSLTATEV